MATVEVYPMTPEERYRERVRAAGCVICNRRLGLGRGPVETHHVAEGSGLRSEFGLVGLCVEHHTGATGLHGMGTKAFILLYRPPGDSEFGLLIWANEDITRREKCDGSND
jgi:hypothetical protein